MSSLHWSNTDNMTSGRHSKHSINDWTKIYRTYLFVTQAKHRILIVGIRNLGPYLLLRQSLVIGENFPSIKDKVNLLTRLISRILLSKRNLK